MCHVWKAEAWLQSLLHVIQSVLHADVAFEGRLVETQERERERERELR